jgi:hypothetical protein
MYDSFQYKFIPRANVSTALLSIKGVTEKNGDGCEVFTILEGVWSGSLGEAQKVEESHRSLGRSRISLITRLTDVSTIAQTVERCYPTYPHSIIIRPIHFTWGTSANLFFKEETLKHITRIIKSLRIMALDEYAEALKKFVLGLEGHIDENRLREWKSS